MTHEPLDLAAIRKRLAKITPSYLGVESEDRQAYEMALAMCDELERLRSAAVGYERIVANQRDALYAKERELDRLRAENARLAEAKDWNLAQRLAQMPVVEAARALVREWDGENKGPTWHPYAGNLRAAVAAYEAQQGEKP